MPPKTDEQKESQKKYMSKFSRIQVRVEPEKYKQIQAHAEAQGESVNGFVNRAIDETMARDTGKVYVRDDGWSDTIKQALQKVDDPPSDRAGNETLQVAQTTMTE